MSQNCHGMLRKYLIEPCLHDLSRLLRKVASLSSLAMLVLKLRGHEECGYVARVGVLAKAINGSRLLLVVSCAVAMFWVAIPNWNSVTRSLVVLLRSGCLTIVWARRISIISTGNGRSARTWALVWMRKTVAHLPSKRILHGSCKSAHSGERLHYGRCRSLLWGLVMSCSVMIDSASGNLGWRVSSWPRWAYDGVRSRDCMDLFPA